MFIDGQIHNTREKVMLKSYEALYENGQVTWVTEQPSAQSARLIVTVLEEIPVLKKRRTFPVDLVGKVEFFGDVVRSIVDEEDWECRR
jgi:hypothetical protein